MKYWMAPEMRTPPADWRSCILKTREMSSNTTPQDSDASSLASSFRFGSFDVSTDSFTCHGSRGFGYRAPSSHNSQPQLYQQCAWENDQHNYRQYRNDRADQKQNDADGDINAIGKSGADAVP